eukprot:TRINITY_DN6127_c0_g1_i2.p1 TRINITY_DN6127_c0_g1~~TRINITY_DN6127_c0_g1_i2.p1  ORF type:complete len:420 (-),score=57.91 TRINITY_DN6127_c0_g1_i2:975-2234(-)
MGIQASKTRLLQHEDGKYSYREVRLPYRSEELKISELERRKLEEWIACSGTNQSSVMNSSDLHERAKVIYDTDIGTDIDDSLALLMLLHLPKSDVEIIGITTAYGCSHLRARVAASIVDAYSISDEIYKHLPIIAGEGVPIGTHRPVWHAGTEGGGLFEPEEIELLKSMPPGKRMQEAVEQKPNRYAAAQFIVDSARAHPGELVLIGVGAATNIAIALGIEPKLPKLVKRLVYMGMGQRFNYSQTNLFPYQQKSAPMEPGKVYFFNPNHNISADTLAAVRVFQQEFKTYVVNDSVTNELWFNGEACASLRKAQSPPENQVVGKLLDCWLQYRSRIFYKEIKGTCPHDALTVAEAIYPGRFVEYATGHLLIHEWAGFSSFVPDPNGPHKIGVSVKVTEFMEFMTNALLLRSEEYRDKENM